MGVTAPAGVPLGLLRGWPRRQGWYLILGLGPLFCLRHPLPRAGLPGFAGWGGSRRPELAPVWRRETLEQDRQLLGTGQLMGLGGAPSLGFRPPPHTAALLEILLCPWASPS